MKLVDIGDLSAASGLAVSTLRHYEALGLIESLGRKGLRRQFGAEAMTQLALISLGKTAGFSLADIKAMFRSGGVANLPRAAFLDRAEALDRQIRRLVNLRDALRHVAECKAENHLECPRFRKLVYVSQRLRQRDGKHPAGAGG